MKIIDFRCSCAINIEDFHELHISKVDDKFCVILIRHSNLECVTLFDSDKAEFSKAAYTAYLALIEDTLNREDVVVNSIYDRDWIKILDFVNAFFTKAKLLNFKKNSYEYTNLYGTYLDKIREYIIKGRYENASTI